MLLINNSIKLIFGALGALAAIATIYSTWFVSTYTAEKKTEERIIDEMTRRLNGVGFNTTKAKTYLKDQGVDEAIGELVRAVGAPVDGNKKSLKTETFEMEVGRIYELTTELISVIILEMKKSQAVISVEGSGGWIALGAYTNLKNSGCELAVLSTSAPNDTSVKNGVARVRIKCK